MTNLPTEGIADWTDYASYWRDADATWLQARSIPRYADATARDADITSPEKGMVAYQEDFDILFLRSSAGSWKRYPALPAFMYATQDDGTAVTLGHFDGSNPGSVVAAASFGPSGLSVPSDLVVRSDVMAITAAGVAIKAGGATVNLTTDGDGLVSDAAILATNLAASAGVTGATITSTGVTTADSLVVTNNADVSGDLTAAKLTVGSVSVQTDGVHAVSALFSEYLSGARVSYDGGDAHVVVQDTDIYMATPSGFSDFQNPVRFQAVAPAQYYDGTTFRGNLACAIYSTGSPAAADYPDGTIWVS